MYDEKRMAANIRKYRIQKGLSQNEFALRLGISPQSVSKWECGLSCPNIENLCLIAELLDISIDGLIYGERDDARTMIGIDGGGTKTEFILFSERGRILNRMLLEGCNPNTVGVQKTVEILSRGIDTFLKLDQSICGIFVGASGLDSGDNTMQVQNMLREKYPAMKIQCENDIFNVIACGKNSDSCIAAICGTGIVVYANHGGQLRRFGGRGYLFDEAGSGYHIGRDALNAVLDAEEGLAGNSILCELIEAGMEGSVWKHINMVYEKGQAYIASFATYVFEAYEKGDVIAEEILQKNAVYFADLINRAAQDEKSPSQIVASGSIVKRNPVFAQLVQRSLKPGLELEVPVFPPVYGACVTCCRLCGCDTEPLKENFMVQYREEIV